MLYKNNEVDLFKESQYEFRNKDNTYEGLTASEEDTAKKFLYRLSGTEGKLEFFRSNTFDFKSFAFNDTRAGAVIGLPTTYLSKTREEFLRDQPLNGFNTLMGQRINLSSLADKETFLANCLLSDDAKLFGLGRAVAETDNYLLGNLDIIADFVFMSLGYAYCFSKNRQLKMQLGQRRRMYVGAIVAVCSLMVLIRFAYFRLMQTIEDKQACNFGLDCAEGSQEFYEKLINRNKILREAMTDGHKYFDKDGNYLKHVVNVPFTDGWWFCVNYFGRKLTERKEICAREFEKVVAKLNKNGAKVGLSEVEDKWLQPREREESEFFKNIRLRLESMKGGLSNEK